MIDAMATIRQANPEDANAIDALISASIAGLFPSTYDPRQTASAVANVDAVDRTLLDDGTFYVVEEDGALIACGGWGRRDRFTHRDERGPSPLLDPARDAAPIRFMFTRPDRTRRGHATSILDACLAAARAEGFRHLVLRASLPGEPLYRRFGFREVERLEIRFPDDEAIEVVDMEMAI